MRPSPVVRCAAHSLSRTFTANRVAFFLTRSAAAVLPLLALPATAGPLAPIWAGAYAGVDIGYSGGSIELPQTGEEIAGSSFIGGGHIGYNFQISALVAGVEADAMVMPGREKSAYGVTAAMDPAWLATVRGRVGFSIANVLLYGTGGYAFQGGSGELRYNGASYAKVSASGEGFVVGGGIEARFLPGVSLRLEGLHYMEGPASGEATIAGRTFSVQNLTAPGFSVVRAGLSFTLN